LAVAELDIAAMDNELQRWSVMAHHHHHHHRHRRKRRDYRGV